MSRGVRLLGAVLAGGESTRFGSDKAAAHVGGEPMVRRVADALREVAADVVIVSSRAVPGVSDLAVIPDRVEGRGPLGGLHAALCEAGERGLDGVLLVGCDLPLVSPELLALVAEAAREAPAAAPSRVGGVEPVCAAYRLEVLPAVERRLDAADRSLHGLFSEVGGVVLELGDGVATDALLNVNTRGDRDRAEAVLGSASPPGLEPTSTESRVISLDAFRGLTIAGMILVNNPGSWSYVHSPLAHAEWHGWTPTDLIFPYFLFVLGVALPFSFRRRFAEGARRVDMFKHVVRRSLILIGLGLFMRAFPDFDVATMRWPGVLQRIGVVYVVAAGLYLVLKPGGRWLAAGALLLVYWALMTLVPVPGYGAGDLSQEGNLAAYLDRLLMGGHLWREMWDPEGLLSTMPAVVTALLGTFTGEWLQSGRAGPDLTKGMLLAGAVLTPLGLAWGVLFPINKSLWTSSYVLFTAGTALLLFGAMYWAIDVKRRRGWWHTPLVVYGMNAIAVFFLSGLLTKMMGRARIGGEGGTSLYGWIYENVFRSWAGDYNGSLAFAASYVALWLALMWVLHRRRIYIRI